MDPITTTGSSTNVVLGYHQLPVIVTTAETVAGGSSTVQTATISSGDGMNDNSSCSNTPICCSSDNDVTTSTTATTTNDDDTKKQKRNTLPWTMQRSCEFLLSLSLSIVGGLCGIRTFVVMSLLHYAMVLFSTTHDMSVIAKNEQARRRRRWWIPMCAIQQQQELLLKQLNAAVVSSSTMALTTIDKGMLLSTHRISSPVLLWPPPTLIALAIFTIVTLIVHPDGYTWIVVHKIRDGIKFVMQSSSTCWAIAVHDYGSLISTILALSTFATLFFFVYVLHCTLKSRTVKSRQHPQNHKCSEKHKRKKRKHTASTRGNKYTGQPAAELQHDSTIHNIIDNASDSAAIQDISERIQNGEYVQHSLPPLAEDVPLLESPPPTGASFSSTLLSLTKYEPSPQQNYHLVSSRSRTASASSATTDSLAGSMDDQSSCSGRSTPTPIGVNDSIHPTFVTAPSTQSLSSANITENTRVKNTSIPNRTMNQSARRNPNNRRNGKKSTHPLADVVPVAANVTNQSPTALTPSKRWDALKPTNRMNAARQPRQPFKRRMEQTAADNIETMSQITAYEKYQQLLSNDANYTVQTPNITAVVVDDLRSGFQHNAFSTPSIGYMQQQQQQQQQGVGVGNAGVCNSTTTINSTIDLNGSTIGSHHNSRSLIAPTDELQQQQQQQQIPFSGLNPNCQSWTGTLNVVPRDETYYCPSSFDSFPVDGAFGCDVPSTCGFQTTIPSSETMSPANYFPPLNTSIYQSNELYANGRLLSSDESPVHHGSTQDGISMSSFDLSFLQDLHESHADNGKSDYGYSSPSALPLPSVDSTMMMSPSAPPAVLSQSPPFHHHYRGNPHVRDNPFATSDDDDDDDDDQIEAELLELGGRMVGCILDC